MLLILIPVAWLAFVAFFVILCQMAAHGDAAMVASSTVTHPSRRAPRRALTQLHGGIAELSPSGTGHLATRPRARASTAGGVRPRRPRCVH
jgi:hypothetical protein